MCVCVCVCVCVYGWMDGCLYEAGQHLKQQEQQQYQQAHGRRSLRARESQGAWAIEREKERES